MLGLKLIHVSKRGYLLSSRLKLYKLFNCRVIWKEFVDNSKKSLLREYVWSMSRYVLKNIVIIIFNIDISIIVGIIIW